MEDVKTSQRARHPVREKLDHDPAYQRFRSERDEARHQLLRYKRVAGQAESVFSCLVA